jgi:integrase
VATAGRALCSLIRLWSGRSVPLQSEPTFTKHIGWHTFGYSLASLLAKKGEGVKVVQELRRHADSPITLDYYVHGNDEESGPRKQHISGLFIVEKAS